MPCTRCRTRHYRCDGEQPQCSRCRQANADCVYETGRRFRRSSIQDSFSAQQRWVSLPPQIQFQDESQEIRACYDVDFSPPATSTPTYLGLSSPNTQQLQPSPASLIAPTEGLTVVSLLNSDSPPETYYHQTQTPQTTPVQYAPSAPPQDYNSPMGLNIQTHQRPPEVLWPLESEQEAMLLRHYIENVALFFDMVDDKHHFGNDVVQLARKNSTLLNSILALSARHLSRTTGFDPFLADRYYEKCFHTLIPALKNANLNDEALLAATIILRLLEEMNIPIIGSDPQGHLTGAQAIIRFAERSYASSTGPSFRQAIYWAAFRQELWMSLMTQRPFQLHIFPTSPTSPPASDSEWATRTIAHVGEVCNFAFGEERNSKARYRMLMDDNTAWRLRRPESFDAYFWRADGDGSGREFPDVRFAGFAHVMGKQYNTLAHVLLVVHDPTIPQIGPGVKQSRLVVDRMVQEDVRTLCGVAQSNPKAFPSKLVACFAIALVGDRFTHREDQIRLREMLIQTEAMHGFPTTTTTRLLERAWGWDGPGPVR